MTTIKIKDCIIGQGQPKIIVPIVGQDKATIHTDAIELKSVQADVVEWRVDFYQDAFDQTKLLDAAKDLSKTMMDLPVLATFRSANEGGNAQITADQYTKMLKILMDSGYVDMVDIEYSMGETVVTELCAYAKKKHVVSVVSSHEWDGTPDSEEMLNRMRNMHSLGGNIVKLAVTPLNTSDVLRLLDVTHTLAEEADYPIMTMSMGSLGVISRIAGETFGSAMTFGAAQKASAPGQIDANALDSILTEIHNASK